MDCGTRFLWTLLWSGQLEDWVGSYKFWQLFHLLSADLERQDEAGEWILSRKAKIFLILDCVSAPLVLLLIHHWSIWDFIFGILIPWTFCKHCMATVCNGLTSSIFLGETWGYLMRKSFDTFFRYQISIELWNFNISARLVNQNKIK